MLSDIYETEDSDDLLVLKTAAKGILKRWKGLTEKDRVEIQKAYPRIYRILSGNLSFTFIIIRNYFLFRQKLWSICKLIIDKID